LIRIYNFPERLLDAITLRTKKQRGITKDFQQFLNKPLILKITKLFDPKF